MSWKRFLARECLVFLCWIGGFVLGFISDWMIYISTEETLTYYSLVLEREIQATRYAWNYYPYFLPYLTAAITIGYFTRWLYMGVRYSIKYLRRGEK